MHAASFVFIVALMVFIETDLDRLQNNFLFAGCE